MFCSPCRGLGGSNVSRVWVSRTAVAECASHSKSDTRLVFMELSAAQGSSEAAARCPGRPEPKVDRADCQSPHPTPPSQTPHFLG